LPYLREFVEKEMGINIEDKSPSQPPPKTFPQPIENPDFLRAIEGAYVRVSFDGMERLTHAHGHTIEVWPTKPTTASISLTSIFLNYRNCGH